MSRGIATLWTARLGLSRPPARDPRRASARTPARTGSAPAVPDETQNPGRRPWPCRRGVPEACPPSRVWVLLVLAVVDLLEQQEKVVWHWLLNDVVVHPAQLST